MQNYEYYLDGGIYDHKGEERTDIYLTESGPSEIEGIKESLTMELKIVNGSSVYSLVDILPKDVIRLAKWMINVATDAEGRPR